MLRARLHAAVTVVHVDVDPLARSSLFAEAASWDSPKERERRLTRLDRDLREMVDEVFGPDGDAVRTMVVRGRPVEEVTRIALEEDVDLVLVGASGKDAVERLLLGSVTQELVRSCPLPVLTVR